ncbi:MAG: bifunctional 2-polyprenyl-6-hydroxyphenol methylase/3-demethylubiquinol 3-O-methyltransferase UbiG [bacterium]|nr:bifunctional 2-polyprenyl-6-hydroxyphenol methylase/3-demethylubiquinol 3-O-methyltransferase UbiG [bacterium]
MTNAPSVNPQEVEQFSALSKHWWSETGPFKALHQMNPLRLAYIRDHTVEHFFQNASETTDYEGSKLPLKGLKFLDIGCGGGILAEPLCRMGAMVTGLDASPDAIQAATEHAKTQDLNIDYRCGSAEDLAQTEPQSFDGVTALEIVEHVADLESFLKSCAHLVRPGGLFFFSTINRTALSYLGAIVAAEHVLRMVPKGTHTWSKFPKPHEIAEIVRPHGLELKDLKGMKYRPWCQDWTQTENLSMNYIGVATASE